MYLNSVDVKTYKYAKNLPSTPSLNPFTEYQWLKGRDFQFIIMPIWCSIFHFCEHHGGVVSVCTADAKLQPKCGMKFGWGWKKGCLENNPTLVQRNKLIHVRILPLRNVAYHIFQCWSLTKNNWLCIRSQWNCQIEKLVVQATFSDVNTRK